MTEAIVVGPGRAGTAVALAMGRSGHTITGVLARRAEAAGAAADVLHSTPLTWDRPLPQAQLMMIAVRDDAIEEVAARLSPLAGAVEAAVHLSGLATLEPLDGLAQNGLATGSFHPLQTFPDAEVGAARIPGAWIAVDADQDGLRSSLRELARSIGAVPFDVAAEARPLYHAAAAAAANFPLAALAMAEDLFAAAGVPFEAAGPLVRAVVDNALTMSPRRALTGPVARGDFRTVAAQLEAVQRSAPEWIEDFDAFVAALARVAGKTAELRGALER